MSTAAPQSSQKSTRATWQSVMSQDVVSTSNIIVDSISTTPIAAFRNPNSGGVSGNVQPEALVLASYGGHTRRPCHVARDTSTQGGFRLTPVLEQEVSEVAAGVAYPTGADPKVHGFFLYTGGLSCAHLDGTSWSAAQTISLPSGVSCSNLRVAYSPAGRLILYGQTATGDLVTAAQSTAGGPFTASVHSMDGALTGGGFFLCMIGEADWVLAANISGAPWVFTGELSTDHYASKQQITAFQKTLKQVVLGYFNPAQNTQMFLLADADDAIHVCSASGDDEHEIQSIKYGKLLRATGHVSQDDGLLHIFGIDTTENLWVLHQSVANPWRDDGTPNWAPVIPIDQGVQNLFGDINPAQSPSFFALDGQSALLLYHQDAATSMWKSAYVQQAAEDAFELVRFRVELTLNDSSGLPLANALVTISPTEESSAADISVGGKLYSATHDTPAKLTTDVSGKVWIAVLANAGIACPSFLVQADGLAEPITVSPAAPVHNYLSGNGTLNPTNPGGPLPVFDAEGKTLINATVGGKPLAPGAGRNTALAGVAAAAIQNTAKIGTGAPPVALAYEGSFEAEKTFFRHVHSPEEVRQLLQSKRLAMSAVGGFWDELKHFFGDIWEGIKNAVITIKDFFVSVGEKIAQFTLQIGEWFKQGVELIIQGVEQVAQFIAGVFHAIEAAVEKVIDWLKALFDFGAIWHTKMAFQEALLELPDYLLKALTGAEDAGEKWFANQKASVDQYFTAIKNMYEGKGLGDQHGFQPPADGPRSQPIAGGASPADFTQNVHHNWLMEKVSSHVDDRQFAMLAAADEDDPFKGFKDHLWSSSEKLRDAFVDMGSALQTLFTDPGEFASLGVPKLIDSLNDVVDALLDFLDAIFHLVLETAELAVSELKKVLGQELPLGFINTLWGWIAKLAGHPEDAKLSLAAFISLIGAFPCTLLFKLIVGVNHEPFPDGRLPMPKARAGATMSVDMPWQCHVTSDSLQILQFFPAFLADFLGNKAPRWVTGVSFGFSLIIWVLANGYPSPIQWVGGILAAAEALVIFQVISASTFLWTNRNDVVNVLLSIYGLGRLAVGSYLVSESKETDPLGNKMALILLPLPPLFAFLNFDAIRNSEAAPFAIGANFFFDFVGYIGGGAAKLFDTAQTIPPLN
jgi:hypothetical protein